MWGLARTGRSCVGIVKRRTRSKVLTQIFLAVIAIEGKLSLKSAKTALTNVGFWFDLMLAFFRTVEMALAVR
jgi:hypothetical protein